MKTYAIHKIKTALNTEGLKITPNVRPALRRAGIVAQKFKIVQMLNRITKVEHFCQPFAKLAVMCRFSSVLKHLIKDFTKKGDTIFDPFTGSGSTGVACLKYQRNFIGSEINKEYFDLSVKRLESVRSQPELF